VKDLKYFAIADDVRQLTTIMLVELRGELLPPHLVETKSKLLSKLQSEDKMVQILLARVDSENTPSLKELLDWFM